VEITKEADFMAVKKYNENEYADVVKARTEKDNAYNAWNNLAPFEYKQDDKTVGAYNDWQNLVNQGSPEYKNTWGGLSIEALNNWKNRDPFSYDLNGDALYQQYKDQYINTGRLAMQDTIGQASAMTGGYGNSYAATAGNQAYQSHLQQLNNIVPDLYQMAYAKYNQEGEDLKNLYGMYRDLENQEYGMYRDEKADYDTALQNAQNLYLTLDEQGYGRQFNEYGLKEDKLHKLYDIANNAYTDGRNFSFNTFSDEQSRQLAADQLAARAYSGGSGGGGGGGKTSSYGDFTASQFLSEMKEAKANGDTGYAKWLVTQAGGNDAAMAIYHEWFGDPDGKPVDTTVNKTGNYGKLTLMEKRMRDMLK
jgi:hypothetical protein